MQFNPTSRCLAVCLALSLAAAAMAQQEGWPRWRGPNENGIVPQPLPGAIPEAGLKRVWAAEVGIGYGSPVAADGKVYLLDMDEAKKKETLTAFNAADGKVVWKQSYDGGWAGSYPGPRCAPYIEKATGRIYTYGGAGELVARKLADGELLWRINILATTKGKNQQWGMASNPLVVGDVIYVQGGIGGGSPALVAVDKNSGKINWTSEAKEGSYAHPVLVQVGGGQQIICFGHKNLYGIDPAGGKTLWTQSWETEYDVNAADPLFHEGKLFVTTNYRSGRCVMFELSAQAAKKLWENKDMTARFNPAILDGGHIYGNSEGVIKCLAWSDGQVKWAAKESSMRLGYGGSLLRSGDKLLALSQTGKLSLLQGTPEGYKLLGQMPLVEGREVWATPAIDGGRLYARGEKELVCVELK